jgi:biopolymer transport protein ExbD
MKTNTSSRRPLAAINLTPLLDVLLILLCVILLSMPMYTKRLPVDLPQTSMAGTPTPMVSLSVGLQKTGQLTLQGTPAQAATILAQISSKTTVELAIDKEVQYDHIAKLVSQLHEKAPKEIVLVTH